MGIDMEEWPTRKKIKTLIVYGSVVLFLLAISLNSINWL